MDCTECVLPKHNAVQSTAEGGQAHLVEVHNPGMKYVTKKENRPSFVQKF